MVNIVYAFLCLISIFSLASGDYILFEDIDYDYPECSGKITLRSDSGEPIMSNLDVYIYLDPFQVIEDLADSITLENGEGIIDFRIFCAGTYQLKAQAGSITGSSDSITIVDYDDGCYPIEYVIDNGENTMFYANIDFVITGSFAECYDCYLNVFEINGDEIIGDTFLDFPDKTFDITLKIVGPGNKMIMAVFENYYSISLLITTVPGFLKYEFIGGEVINI